ncbi:cyclophilin-like fold protein [Pyrinomonas methylaliphatogenes]|uniref:cyclophilin-like fold protein n=1 Tax=Pyrinomonas methylaliphatogenes TaxID=454194 RepID=UPI00138DD5D4
MRVIIRDAILNGRLWDNVTARDLIAHLSLTLTFRDFNHVEKIADRRLPPHEHFNSASGATTPLPIN